MNPWEVNERPEEAKAIAKCSHLCSVFTNDYGEDFVAYILLKEKQVKWSGCDIGWKWQTIDIESKDKFKTDKILSQYEAMWLENIINQATTLVEEKKRLESYV